MWKAYDFILSGTSHYSFEPHNLFYYVNSFTSTVVRVPHRYTAGTIFPHRTCTRGHCDPWRVSPLPNRNSRSVKQVPTVFCSINYKYVYKYLVMLHLSNMSSYRYKNEVENENK